MFRVAILILAIGAGGIAAWMALAMRAEPAAVSTIVQAPAATTERAVLVAVADVAQGQALTRENMRWQPLPESAFNPAFISREARPNAIESMAGWILRGPIAAGEPLRDDKLSPPTSGLSAMLSSGKRAVAVRVTAENTAGGFVLPNDRVDVLHTQSISSGDKNEGLKESVTHTILTNVLVLAVDQSLDEKHVDDKSKAKLAAVGKTATLEVNQTQAELITASEASGTLSLALRSAADNGDTTTTMTAMPVAERPLAPREVLVLRGGAIMAPAAPKSP